MRLDGRRESTNVEDRRGKGGAVKAGELGLGGIIIVGLIWLLTGRAPDTQVLQQMTQGGGTEYATDGKDYSEVDVELMQFCKQILAGTEDVWTQEFRKMGMTYRPPKMVIFAGAVNSGCGSATSDSGPFYCSADQTVYLDLEFFKSMKRQIGADGDFAYAYVIAHEVGHHVQNLLGTLDAAHNKMAQYGKNTAGYNQTSVRLELQADFYAGVWAYHDNKMFGSLEDGDIEEALNAAAKIGDDYLQKQAYGRTMPETFNHGTSAQRSKWLKKGLRTGDVSQGDTFSPSYNML
ncbi:MAG: neutral zinc metallopeptidase [Bacteroidales bacterium]|nr:neutral zinc metallopeptidase [Bacteroidales bacterium]